MDSPIDLLRFVLHIQYRCIFFIVNNFWLQGMEDYFELKISGLPQQQIAHLKSIRAFLDLQGNLNQFPKYNLVKHC